MVKSILVVEDNQNNAELLEDILGVRGYVVNIVTRGEDALDAVSKMRPNLILMDIQLPGIDGYEITRRLKKNPDTADIPVIAVTAYALKGDEMKALRAGCDDYVSKPINTRDLPEIVEKYIGPAD
jgi:CheY-like chemotaxis protein